MSVPAPRTALPVTKPTITPAPPGLLQRQCACGGNPGPSGECEQCKRKRLGALQRAAAGPGPAPAVPPIVHEVLRSPGQPLDTATRFFMEPRFGHDFSQVRVHTDAKAAESAKAVNALAYTVGRNVVFGEGMYVPNTHQGRKLMAHELTHVVQQGLSHSYVNLAFGQSGDIYEQEAEQIASQENVREQLNIMHPLHFFVAPVGRLQRQLITPFAAGGGFSRFIEQDRRPILHVNQRQDNVPPAQPQHTNEDDCNVQLCFLPLEVLLNQGVSPEMAYITAVHAYIRWDNNSAGFTRENGERIGDARVISPEPRAGEPHERCVQARLRTIPWPTPGQLVSFTPLGALRDIASYSGDIYTGLGECWNPTCQSAKQRIQNMLVDNRRGLYSLFDENCETWARNVLSAACMEAPSTPNGGYGNLVQQILRETPGGDLYHLARRLLGRTRPMPRQGR